MLGGFFLKRMTIVGYLVCGKKKEWRARESPKWLTGQEMKRSCGDGANIARTTAVRDEPRMTLLVSGGLYAFFWVGGMYPITCARFASNSALNLTDLNLP